jgi:hypothetical protein
MTWRGAMLAMVETISVMGRCTYESQAQALSLYTIMSLWRSPVKNGSSAADIDAGLAL